MIEIERPCYACGHAVWIRSGTTGLQQIGCLMSSPKNTKLACDSSTGESFNVSANPATTADFNAVLKNPEKGCSYFLFDSGYLQSKLAEKTVQAEATQEAPP